jgi:Glu-tRNA(Gln) amidotransferase subunit E-like FAD-binding protein
LRACKVKRGIGTIRQDVNVSIKGHDRVEIKGFQDPSMFVKTIDLEIERQNDDLNKNIKDGNVRNAKEDGTSEFLRPMPGKARMYPETDLPLLKIGREKINFIKKKLPKLKHEIRAELEKKGLHGELIELVIDGNLDEFETLIKIYNKEANLIGKMITLWRTEVREPSWMRS